MRDDGETIYFNQNGTTKGTGKPGTMVIELKGSTWRIVTTDGYSWKEMVSQLAKSEGKQMDDRVLNFPLRVTAETYVLAEPVETNDANYSTKNRHARRSHQRHIHQWIQSVQE